jgi:predicted MPP superfamily phosphohydrolase
MSSPPAPSNRAPGASRLPWRRWPRIAVAIEIVVVALLGCWLGVVVGGSVDASVGPVETRMSISPSWTGDSVVAVPPLGRLSLDSHDGPLRLDAQVTRINTADARRIFNNPASVRGLPETVAADVRSGVIRLAVRAAIAAVAGGLLLGLLVFRRRLRRILLTGALAGAVMLACGGIAAATFNPKSVNEPTYDGLLAIAPTVVGDAQSIVADFRKYEQQLAKIVTNVSRLYDVTSTLPAYNADPSTIRMLHVSDLHLNPAAWEIMRSVAKQFEVDLIVDSGDITDHGSAPEDRFLDTIATLGVPYVFVRGNHDSVGTEGAVAAQPNAVVLNHTVQEVAGLRLLGAPDPRFTPDKDTRGKDAPPTVEQVGEQLAATARAQPATAAIDAVVVHDPEMGLPADGAVPLVLAGHTHKRDVRRLDGGTLLFTQGSTGGAGLRGLEGEKPTPVQLSVLYFDRESRTLQAWDDITLGGLGLTSAQIERHVAEPPEEGQPAPTQSPDQSLVKSRSVPYAFGVPDG